MRAVGILLYSFLVGLSDHHVGQGQGPIRGLPQRRDFSSQSSAQIKDALTYQATDLAIGRTGVLFGAGGSPLARLSKVGTASLGKYAAARFPYRHGIQRSRRHAKLVLPFLQAVAESYCHFLPTVRQWGHWNAECRVHATGMVAGRMAARPVASRTLASDAQVTEAQVSSEGRLEYVGQRRWKRQGQRQERAPRNWRWTDQGGGASKRCSTRLASWTDQHGSQPTGWKQTEHRTGGANGCRKAAGTTRGCPETIQRRVATRCCGDRVESRTVFHKAGCKKPTQDSDDADSSTKQFGATTDATQTVRGGLDKLLEFRNQPIDATISKARGHDGAIR